MKNNSSSGVVYYTSVVRKLRIGSFSLIAGSVAFLSFWFLAATSNNNIIPWPVSFAAHGISIVLLSIGLIFVARKANEPSISYWVTWVGVAVAIAGLLTVFPLIPFGFGIFAIGLIMTGIGRKAAVITMAGSALLLVTVALGARVGMEDAPELSDGLRIAFQIGVLLVAVGLIVIGLGETRRISRRVK